jgi:DNA-binding PadR family transcriptional regulator
MTDARRKKPTQPSSLGLIVLWLLIEAPQHVYGLHKQIEAYSKQRVVNVRARNSLYQAIDRLVRLGLVAVHETVKSDSHPDRVVYAITPDGRDAAHDWLRQILRSGGDEYPDFIAALSIAFGLAPDDLREQLEIRFARLAAQLAETDDALTLVPDLPRLFLLEEEYRRAILAAELAWLRGIIEDLREGRLTWTEEWLRAVSAAHTSQTDQDDEP